MSLNVGKEVAVLERMAVAACALRTKRPQSRTQPAEMTTEGVSLVGCATP